MKRIKQQQQQQQQQPIKSAIKKAKSNESVKEKHPLQVYCRVRPLQNENEQSCVSIESPTSLLLTVTDANRAGLGLQKQMRFLFKHVFDETATQLQVFNETSLPLVQNLIEGRNGLLFTYGVSNSGKSFTMDGAPDNLGIMPRSISVLFNSINTRLAPKYLFKPDKLNGFDVQSEPDALLERQRELMSSMRNPKSAKKKDAYADMRSRGGQASTQKLNINDENVYAVFITYIEIYNNCVYDLLEDYQSDDCTRVRALQPKIIREDGSKNMYVHGVDEIEVTTPDEAVEIFYKGQKRRRLAHTALNTESSRSHSVFTIRLVQAPSDAAGGDRRWLTVSQLSLVDLAGSERTSRARTAGQRLREAGNINNSLMTLRTCFELLRDNQLTGGSKMIPYRESRLTHLFKNYFDGDGDVRMIICVNPRAGDCDEINHVLKFAEMSQEVKVNRIRPPKEIPCPPPAKRKPPSTEMKQQEEIVTSANSKTNLSSSFLASCRFQQAFPVPEITDPENNGFITETLQVMLARKEKAKELQTHIKTLANSFRVGQESFFNEVNSIQDEYKRLAENNREKDQTIEELRRKIHQMDSEKLNLKMKCTSTEHYLRSRENELADKEEQLSKEQEAREREKMRMKDQITQKTEKLAKELQRQKSQMEMEMWQRDRRLRKVKKILDSGPSVTSRGATPSATTRGATPSVTSRYPPSTTESSESDVAPLRLRNRILAAQFKTPQPKHAASEADLASKAATVGRVANLRSTFRRSRSSGPGERLAETPQPTATESEATTSTGGRVANLRSAFRRSRSAGPGDVWLDHRPPNVPPDTLFQPVMKRSHPVDKLTDIRQVNKSSKYCLTVLDKDSDGDIETCLYKGDVLPTSSGGAQVTFSDVEILKQKSPIDSPTRKRSSARNAVPYEDIENRCAVSVECHAKKSRR
ncbi:kinesin-like protein KIF23 [Nilaparvata lugens]|uniref:kinesin-like protein KIF23 n=1 Tax=Nilaparvata lugens TaxID=108931 RepID=UPI00193D3800|nr:kinesin-like protein KIF23 [Nilaparvata lugens]